MKTQIPAQDIFLVPLPNEVLRNIFSTLTQSDCIESQRVSKMWHVAIPCHVKDIWKEVFISGLRPTLVTERFLGHHVRTVELVEMDDKEVGRTLSRLWVHGCHSLTKLSIDFALCLEIPRRLVMPWSKTLAVLELTDIKAVHIVYIRQTILSCTNLTTLTYTGHKREHGDFTDKEDIDLADDFEDDLPIQTLYVDCGHDLHFPSNPAHTSFALQLLEHVPQLTSLAIRGMYRFKAIMLHHIKAKCPKLELFAINCKSNTTPAHVHEFAAQRSGTLRHLLIDDGVDFVDDGRNYFTLIEKHQTTLESLSVRRLMMSDFEAAMQRMQTIRLKNLEIMPLNYLLGPDFAGWLARSPSLEKVSIDTHGAIDASVIRALGSLSLLKHLSLNYSGNCLGENEPSFCALFKAFQDRGSASQLASVQLSSGTSLRAAYQHPRNSLALLPRISSLRKVSLGRLWKLDAQVRSFFLSLSKSRVEVLDISHLSPIDQTVFEYLAQMTHLKYVVLQRSYITDMGAVKRMMTRSRTLHTVKIMECSHGPMHEYVDTEIGYQ